MAEGSAVLAAKRWLLVGARLVGLWALWLLLAGSSAHEALVGAAAAALGTLASEVVRTCAGEHTAYRWRWLAQLWRVPAEIVRGTGAVARVVWCRLVRRQQAGSIVGQVAFDNSGPPRASAARRALVVIYGTTSPNFIAIDFDHLSAADGGPVRLVFHQLTATEDWGSLSRLGVRP